MVVDSLIGTYHQIMDHQNSLKFPDDVEISKAGLTKALFQFRDSNTHFRSSANGIFNYFHSWSVTSHST